MITRDLNENAILGHIVARGVVTASSIAQDSGLPNSTIVSVIRRMTERGLIRRGNDLSGKRGRPLATYSAVLPHPVIVCLVEGISMSAAHVAPDLSVSRVRKHTKLARGGAGGWVEEVTQLIHSVAEEADAQEVVLCVNAVEVEGQTLTSSVVPRIGEVIGRLVTKNLPIRVEWSQWPVLLAAYRRLEDPVPDPMLLLHIADGVSAHSMIGGEIFRGGSGLAGELGHVIVQENGPPCGCGRNGCLEACCSGPAICDRIETGLAKGIVCAIDPDAFVALSPADAMEVVWQYWLAGDEFIRRVMDQIFDQLAWAVGFAINLVDPQAVVAAGYVLQRRSAWLDEIERRVQRWVIHAGQRKIRFIESHASLTDIFQTAALQHFYRGRQAAVSRVASHEAASLLSDQHIHRLLGEAATTKP